MAHVIVIGAGLGGVPAAFDLRKHYLVIATQESSWLKRSIVS